MASLNAIAIDFLPIESAYNILALLPTTKSFFPASSIHLRLSEYCCLILSGASEWRSVSIEWAIESDFSRSISEPEVHTQRNGPKP